MQKLPSQHKKELEDRIRSLSIPKKPIARFESHPYKQGRYYKFCM